MRAYRISDMLKDQFSLENHCTPTRATCHRGLHIPESTSVSEILNCISLDDSHKYIYPRVSIIIAMNRPPLFSVNRST